MPGAKSGSPPTGAVRHPVPPRAVSLLPSCVLLPWPASRHAAVHIFIDESGVFVVPSDGRSSVSVVAAVAVPDSRLAALQSDFGRLGTQWGIAVGEIKGRELSESQFAVIHELLAAHDVFAVIGAVDLGTHTDAGLTQYRRRQAARIDVTLSTSGDAALRSQASELARRIETLPNQLYVQMLMLDVVINTVLHLALVRDRDNPSGPGRFAWRIDAKDRSRTEYEKLWKTLVAPFAQSFAPLFFSDEPDDRALRASGSEFLEAGRAGLGSRRGEREDGVNGPGAQRLLLDDFVFANSRSEPGLQIADVVANCFRRACSGRLQASGWSGLGRLLRKDPRFGEAIRFCQFGATGGARTNGPYDEVILTLEREARPVAPL